MHNPSFPPAGRFPLPPNVPVLGNGGNVAPGITLQFQISDEMLGRLRHYKGEIPLEGLSLINLVFALGVCALDAMLIQDEKERATSE